MMKITRITNIDDKKHIAILDTSSISFMQGLQEKGILSDSVLEDYDLILIPEWVMTEINDAKGRADIIFGQNEKEKCRRGFYNHFGRNSFLVLSTNRGIDCILTR